MNPRNGRSERIFVNLEAIYPTPDAIGSELSFEELRASHRGLLSKVWKPEPKSKVVDENSTSELQDRTEESGLRIDTIDQSHTGKLIIAGDAVVLDENGVAKEGSREGRSRKMKIKEVNETQISKQC